MSFGGKVAMITGGASGLGRHTAQRLMNQGAKVLLFDMPSSQGEQVAREMGKRARFIAGDVRSEDDVKTALDHIENEFNEPLNVLINCAGILATLPTLNKDGVHSLELFQRLMDVNVVGTFNTCRLGAERMSKADPNEGGERGVIINTSSVGGHDGSKYFAAYCTSKAAVLGLTLPLARDLGKYGIRVVSISPGVMETPMVPGSVVSEKHSQDLVFPIRRGETEDYARTALHIIESPFINGTDIRIDGGYRSSNDPDY